MLKRLLLSILLFTAVLNATPPTNENVTTLYVAMFDRAPDSKGLDYWVKESGLDLEGIAQSFFEQGETQEKYPPGTTEEEFVLAVYANLFNRQPDAEGLKYWKEELEAERIPRSLFVLAVINGAMESDAEILNNKTEIGLAFACDGRSDTDEAYAVIQGITADPQSVTDAMIKFNLPECQPSNGDELTEDQKYSLAYMWHEEKLAKEIYLELNKINPAQQLENIATKSEVKHIAIVQDLVEAYDINITNLADYEVKYSVEELNSMPVGKFAVPEIQELYDALYDIGRVSKQASLEVGCMVEVVDIVDLDRFIVTPGNPQAIIDAFTVLRAGSYTHYWAFDKGLINMGVSDGCCSLGSEYCHPEYPKSENGGGGKGKR